MCRTYGAVEKSLTCNYKAVAPKGQKAGSIIKMICKRNFDLIFLKQPLCSKETTICTIAP